MVIQQFFPFAAQAGFVVPSARFAERFNAVAAEMNVGSRLERIEREESKDVVFGLSQPAHFRSVLVEMERQRLETVRESALFHDRIPFRAPLELLSATEQKAVRLFASRVKPALNRIEARQQDAQASRLAALMVHHGDYYSMLLWSRFRQNVLAGPYSGSLFPFFPDRPAISGMFDPSITLDDFRNLSAALAVHSEELRPTTVLSRKQDGTIIAVPLPLHPDFRKDHRILATALEDIADLRVDGPLDERLQYQLRTWARFFRSGSATDEAIAAQATIDAGEGGGLLRVHLGPSESYWADNTKFAYLLQVGIRDPELSRSLDQGKETFSAMEESLAGIPHYTTRELSTRGGFADPIYQVVTGGFIESFPRGEPLGNNYPNYRYPDVEGSNRFILLEGVEVAARQIKTALSRLLDEDVSNWDAQKHFIHFVVAHESGHLLGPLRDHVTPGGQSMGSVFGHHWGSADEPKADLTIATLVRLDQAHGQMEAQAAKDLLRALVGSNLSNRYRGKAVFAAGKLTDHLFGHMVQVGWFFEQKAFTLTEDGKIHVDYDRLMESAEDLWRRIITYQAAGELEEFLEFSRRTVAQIPDKADALILKANEDLKSFFVERYLP